MLDKLKARIGLGKTTQPDASRTQKPDGSAGTQYSIQGACCTIAEGVTELKSFGADVNRDEIREVILPSSLRSIGKKCFSGCKKLERVVFPPLLHEIGDYAFCHCKALTEAPLPSGLKTIGEYAFFDTGLREVAIPEGMVSIQNFAFSWCKGLQRVHIPKNAPEMGKYVFSGCDSVQHWDVPAQWMAPQYKIENGILRGCSYCVDVEEAVIPEGVTVIEKGGVPSCVRRIRLPGSLKAIGRAAFRDFKRLEQIIIPEGVTEIGDEAFHSCKELRSIRLPAALQEIRYGTFFDCQGLERVEFSGSIHTIGAGAFRKCGKLTDFSFPVGLREISCCAFAECESLKAAVLPATVTQIHYEAFRGCTGLTEVRIPGGITELPRGVFSQCTGLCRVEIPESVVQISRYAFTGCEKLEAVACAAPERFEAAFLDTPFWKKRHPDRRRPIRMPLNLVGLHTGKELRDLGYLFFSPDREYSIGLPGEDGVVVVSAYYDEDGPDEDGFGMEIYYDWWMLDEALEMIPGIPMWHAYSNLDKRNANEKWDAQRQKAGQILNKRSSS